MSPTKDRSERTRAAVQAAAAAKRAGHSPTDTAAAASAPCPFMALGFSPPASQAEFNAGRSSMLTFACEMRNARLGFDVAMQLAQRNGRLDYLRGALAALVDVLDAVQTSGVKLDTTRVAGSHSHLVLRAHGQARRGLMALTPASQRAEVVGVLVDVASGYGPSVKLRQVEASNGTIINVLPAPVVVAHPARAVQTVSRNSAGEMVGSRTEFEGLL